MQEPVCHPSLLSMQLAFAFRKQKRLSSERELFIVFGGCSIMQVWIKACEG